MILSSADILRILGGSEIVRLSAKLKIVDGRPALSGAEGLFIYIERFPEVEEFQATWSIYIESDGSEPDDLVVAEIKKLLPSVTVTDGLLTVIKTTDFLSESTQRRPEASKEVQPKVDLTQYEERFQGLVEDVQDQMLLVGSGKSGKDGFNGKDGRDGKDGKDLIATEADLEDLQNVETAIPMERGQVLTWDGTKWTNLFVPRVMSAGGAISTSTGRDDDGLGGIVNTFWKFDDDETEGYRAGRFRVNSHQNTTDWSLTTELYLSFIDDADSNIKNYILQLILPGQYVYIQRQDEPDAFAMYSVAASPVQSGPDGARIEVVFITQGPSISNLKDKDLCGLTFALVSGGGAGGGAVGEAPTDGQAYVRRNSSWIPTTTSSVEYNLSQNSIEDLGNVNTAAMGASQRGDGLIWDGSAWNNGGDFAGGAF